MPTTNNTEDKRPRLTEKALQKMSLRDLTVSYNLLNKGQVEVKAGSFKSKADAIKRIRALQRKLRRTVTPGEGTIREFAEELLLQADKKTGEGMKYSDILYKVQEEFPDAKTSRSSLRWYAAQMRVRGDELPQRPLDV